jgi:hypothetical protein
VIQVDHDAHPGLPTDASQLIRLAEQDGAYIVLASATPVVTEREVLGQTQRLIGYPLLATVEVTDIVQYGDASGPLPTLDASVARRILTTPVAELAITIAPAVSPSASAVLSLLLGSRGLPGWGGGLPDAWLDTGVLSPLAGVLATSLDSYDLTQLWVAPVPRAKTLDCVSIWILRPLGLGLAHDDGIARVIDWGVPDGVLADTIDDAATRQPRAYQWQRDAYQGASMVRLTMRDDVHVIAADRGSGSLIGTTARDIPIDAYVQVAQLIDRWSLLTYRYAVAVPVVSLAARTGAARVGDLVALTRSDLPQRASATPADEIGVVVERGRSLRTDVDALTIVVTSWIEDARSGRWGPTATIASVVSAGGDEYEVTITADDWSEDDAAGWASVDLPESIALLDASGAVLDSPCVLLFVSGTTLQISTNGATPTAGDLLVLDTYAQITGGPNLARWSWLADSAGDPPYVWGP